MTNNQINMEDLYDTDFALSKEFTFEAAHQLTKVPTGHQCGNVHGHSYTMRVHLIGKLDPARDWVVDYADIAKAVRPLIKELDHSFLNDVVLWRGAPIETTAEILSWWSFKRLKESLPALRAVEILETATTSVIYRV